MILITILVIIFSSDIIGWLLIPIANLNYYYKEK